MDRITGYEVRLITSRLKTARAQGVGTVQRDVKRVILRLGTADGLEGWGECAPWEVFSGTAEQAAAALDLYLRPLVLGVDPRQIQAILARCDKALYEHWEAKAALEMALFDLVGKAAGLPVYDLLGGQVRARIPLSFSLANPDTAHDVAVGKAMCAQGHFVFKVKTGFSTHANDMARLARFRAELPATIDLRIDFNQGLEAWNAIRFCRDMESFKPTFIEQPVKRPLIHVMAAIAEALDTPLMADESAFTAVEALRVVEARAADIVSVKLMKSGGILGGRKTNAICEAAGIPCYGGTLFEGGIALAAGTHFIAATANMSLGCEFYMPKYAFDSDILVEDMAVESGHVVVPTGPGLGIRVDEAKLKAATAMVRA
jgi:muconate cycloisomerase